MTQHIPLPVGVRFRPTASELITFFLLNKCKGEPLPHDAVRELDPFEKEPWLIFDEASVEHSHVFTKLKKKDKQWRSRRVGCGIWEFQSSQEIRNIEDEQFIIGYDREFVFLLPETAENTPYHGTWVMHQYSKLPDNGNDKEDEEREEYVICAVRNKDLDAPDE